MTKEKRNTIISGVLKYSSIIIFLSTCIWYAGISYQKLNNLEQDQTYIRKSFERNELDHNGIKQDIKEVTTKVDTLIGQREPRFAKTESVDR